MLLGVGIAAGSFGRSHGGVMLRQIWPTGAILTGLPWFPPAGTVDASLIRLYVGRRRGAREHRWK